jgi:hypothetical protein
MLQVQVVEGGVDADPIRAAVRSFAAGVLQGTL